MRVICSHAGLFCGSPCPHMEPHEPHGPKETPWDGDRPCTEAEFCDGGADVFVMCRPVSLR